MGGRRAPDERERALTEGIRREGVVAHEAGHRPRAGGLDAELEAQRRGTGRGAMLDAEFNRGVGPEAVEVEIRIAAMPRSG